MTKNQENLYSTCLKFHFSADYTNYPKIQFRASDLSLFPTIIFVVFAQICSRFYTDMKIYIRLIRNFPMYQYFHDPERQQLTIYIHKGGPKIPPKKCNICLND